MADANVKIRGGGDGNATQIQSRDVDAAAPSDTNVLAWSASDSEWEPTAAGGSSEWTDTGTILHPTDSSGTVDSVVVGGTTTANSDVVLGVDGSAVFNDQAAGVDFRVESVGLTLHDPIAGPCHKTLFVDGSTNRVMINVEERALLAETTDPESLLHIKSQYVNNSTTLDLAMERGITLDCGGGVAVNDFFPAIRWYSDDGSIDTSEYSCAAVTAQAAENFSGANTAGTDLVFFTHAKDTDSDGPTERLRVESEGAVALKSQSSSASATTDYSKFYALQNGAAADSGIVLLLHGQGVDSGTVFTDSSQSNHSATKTGTVETDTAQSTLSQASSIRFDGSSDYLTYADSDDWTLDGDFTVDFFVRFASLNTGDSDVIYGPTATSGEPWRLLRHQDTTNWQFSAGNGLSPTYECTSTVAINTWYHIATTRASGIIRTVQDGTQIGVDSSSNTTTLNNDALVLGRNWDSGAAGNFDGWIQEFRITKGTALWTTGFTPPTAPVAATSEMYVLDEIGNETKLSSHTPDGSWEYYSKSPKGEVTRINMEEVVRDLGELTGKDYIKDK